MIPKIIRNEVIFMIMLTLMAVCFTVVIGIVAFAAVMLGVGLLPMLCLGAAGCVIVGVFALIKLLAKGVFSLLKCVVLMCLMVVPVVNIVALAIILVCAFKYLFAAARS